MLLLRQDRNLSFDSLIRGDFKGSFCKQEQDEGQLRAGRNDVLVLIKGTSLEMEHNNVNIDLQIIDLRNFSDNNTAEITKLNASEKLLEHK